jgi:hypothetical protein
MTKQMGISIVLIGISQMTFVPISQGEIREVSAQAKTTYAKTDAPVRIPRTFFEKSIIGSIHAQTLNQPSGKGDFQSSSPLTWIEYPTQLPAPQPGARADFRDFKGCLQYSDNRNLSICFNVMPDVSSVGMNTREMSLDGVEKIIAEQLLDNCPFSLKKVEITQADRTESGYIAKYAVNGDILPAQGCETGNQTFQVDVEFNQI